MSEVKHCYGCDYVDCKGNSVEESLMTIPEKKTMTQHSRERFEAAVRQVKELDDANGNDSPMAALIAQLWAEVEAQAKKIGELREALQLARDAVDNGWKSQCYCDDELTCKSCIAMEAIDASLAHAKQEG